MTDNRHGLALSAALTAATGTAEAATASRLLRTTPYRHAPVTVGADHGFDTLGGVTDLRAAGATPHLAQQMARRRAVNRRTTRHPGYAVSHRQRKQVERA